MGHREQQADAKTSTYLTLNPATTIRLEHLEGFGDAGRWLCELQLERHPASSDMPLTVKVTGYGRQGTIDLAHAELRNAVREFYLYPEPVKTALNVDREAMSYMPGNTAIRRVEHAMAARGHAPASYDAIAKAGLRMTIDLGAVRVGDVVNELLQARPVHSAQPSLL